MRTRCYLRARPGAAHLSDLRCPALEHDDGDEVESLVSSTGALGERRGARSRFKSTSVGVVAAAAAALMCGCSASNSGSPAPLGTVGLPALGGAGVSSVSPGGGTGGTGAGAGATAAKNPSPLPTTSTGGVGGAGLGTGGAVTPMPVGTGGSGMVAMTTGGTGGIGGGTAGTGTGGVAMMPPQVNTSSDPTIPAITGDCPSLETGPINFMGETGQVEAGPMPSSPTAPMLLYWHGTGSTAGEYAFMAADVAQGVTSQGGVIVSFESTTNQGDCSPSGTFIFCTGDFDVMDQYVACAVKNRNVDPHRIYTAGCSAGGLMATAMAMQRSEYIASATPNSGGVTFGGAFSSDHTPALMTIHGAPGSDVVGVDFSQTSATADMLFKQHGGFAVDCNTGGGHCGGAPLAPDAWTFLQAHPYGVDPEPYAGGLPAGFSSQCSIQ